MQLLSFKELKKLVSVTQPTLLQWVKEGLITKYQTPKGHLRYDPDEILNLLRQGKKED